MVNAPNFPFNQIFNPDPEYKNLLHPKPLCHRFYNGMNTLGTTVDQNVNKACWHGKVLMVITKGILATGYCLNMVIGVVEVIAALSFFLPTFILSNSTFNKTKVLSYGQNAIIILHQLKRSLSSRKIISKYHSLNAISSHAIHIMAALYAQRLFFEYKNQFNDQVYPREFIKAIRILIESSSLTAQDIRKAAVRDLALGNRIRNNEDILLRDLLQVNLNRNLQAFLQDNPHQRAILNQFTFDRFLHDQVYSRELLNLLGIHKIFNEAFNDCAPGGPFNIHVLFDPDRYIAFDLPQRPVQAPLEPDQVYGAIQNENDKNYQNALKDLIKKSFIELHDHPALLVRMLSNKKDEAESIKDGREELITFSATQQVANYAQLKELESLVACPKKFETENLQQYNNRYELLQEAKALLNKLRKKEKQILVEKLLRMGDFDLDAQGLSEDRKKIVQELFNAIGNLALKLHKGPLATEKIVNIDRLNQEDVHAAYNVRNLFQEACRQAEEKITAR